MNQREQATIDLVINGRQAETNVGAVGRAVVALTRDLRSMNEAEDPARYEELIQRRNQLNQTYIEMDQRIRSARRSLQDLEQETDQADSRLTKFWEHVKSFALGNVLGNAVSGVLNSIQGIIDGSQQAFEESELTQTALLNKLKQTGGAAGETMQALVDLQQKEMDLTGVDDDVIAKGEEMMLGFTNVRGVIFNQAIPAMVSYTAAMNGGKVTMEGIQSTALVLGKGLDDLTKIKKTAKAMSIDLSQAEYAEIEAHRKNNDIIGGQQIFIDALNKRVGNLAETLSQTETGSMQRYETRIGNIQESIGKWIVSGKSLMANFLSPFLSLIEQLTSTKLSDTLKDERMQMNLLALQITDTNTKHDDRIKLIKKLQDMYPDHLKNLNAEKSTNLEIANAVEKVNDMYINRIILAKKDEEIEKQNQTTAELRLKRVEAEQKMREEIIKVHQKLPWVTVPNDGTTYEKLSAMLAQYEKTEYAAHKTTGGIFDPTFGANRAISEYKAYLEFSQGAEGKVNAMLKARQQLIKDLGIDENFNGKKPEGTPTTAPPRVTGGGLTDAEKQAAKTKLEAYNKQLEELRSQYLELAAAAQQGTVDDLDAQLKVIDDKYNKIVSKLLALSKDPHVTALVKQELLGDIDEINKKGGLREGAKKVATTDFNQKQDEKNQKADEDSRKQVSDEQGALENRVNSFFDTQKGSLDNEQSTAEATAKSEQARQNIQEDFATRNLQLEKQRYQALLDVRKTFAKDAGDIERKLGKTELDIANDTSKKKAKAQAEDFALAKTLTNSLADMTELTMGNSSAGIAMQKLIATTQIGIDTAQAISAATKTGAYVGFTPIEKAIAIAGNIAVVLANMVKAKSVLSGAQDVQPGTVKKYAEGSYTGMAMSNDPAGYVNVPTLFTSKYIAGEAGGEWIAPNWMLKNPYTANVVGAMEALRQRGPGAVSSTAPAGDVASKPANPSTTGVTNDQLLAALMAIHGAIQDQEVFINYQTFTRDMNRIAKLKTTAGNNG